MAKDDHACIMTLAEIAGVMDMARELKKSWGLRENKPNETRRKTGIWKIMES